MMTLTLSSRLHPNRRTTRGTGNATRPQQPLHVHVATRQAHNRGRLPACRSKRKKHGRLRCHCIAALPGRRRPLATRDSKKKKGKANAIVSTRRTAGALPPRTRPVGRWVSKVALPLWRFCTRASRPVPGDGVVPIPN